MDNHKEPDPCDCGCHSLTGFDNPAFFEDNGDGDSGMCCDCWALKTLTSAFAVKTTFEHDQDGQLIIYTRRQRAEEQSNG